MSDAAEIAPVKPIADRWLIGAWYGVVVLATATVLSTVNNILINLMTDSIKKEIGLSDTEIGALGGLGMVLMTGFASYPMGWLADRVDRRFLMFACVGIWTAATVGFGFSNGFTAMLVWAALMSIGEAVLAPMSYSIIPDLFPREKWIIANYVFYVSALLGVSIGFGASAGLIAWVEAHRSALPFGLGELSAWRAALIASTFTGPILMAAVLFIPLRKRVIDRATSSTGGMLAYMRKHARALSGVFFGFGVSYAALGTIRGWLAPTLTRDFGQTPAQVGAVLSWTTAFASVGGVALGWVLNRALQRRFGEMTTMRVAQFGIFAAIAATFGALFAPNAGALYALSALSVAFFTVAFSLSPTILQFLSPPGFRARLISIGGMVTIMCASAAPVLVGLASDHLFGGTGKLLWSSTLVALPALVIGLSFMLYGASALPETFRDAARQSSPPAPP